jgi:ATP-dependent helicase/nuclease subunit A
MLFQRLKYNNTLDMTSFLQKWFGAEANSYASSFKYVLNLNEPPMKKLIEVGEVEWGFQFQAGDGVLEGQIDLWGIVTGPENLNPTCWVIDYKSGSSNYSDKAFDQLRLYSYVLAQHGVTAPIKMAVVYVLEKKIEVRDFQENVELRSVSILQSDYFKKFMGSKSQINT